MKNDFGFSRQYEKYPPVFVSVDTASIATGKSKATIRRWCKSRQATGGGEVIVSDGDFFVDLRYMGERPYADFVSKITQDLVVDGISPFQYIFSCDEQGMTPAELHRRRVREYQSLIFQSHIKALSVGVGYQIKDLLNEFDDDVAIACSVYHSKTETGNQEGRDAHPS